MKKEYFFVIFFLVLAIFFVINASSVNAKMYKILDSEGNVIRLTNNPTLSIKEKEAGYTVFPPPGGSIEPMQDQTINEQDIERGVSSENGEYDFRKTNWGMGKEEVKATEDKKPDYEENNSLGYDVKIDGDDYYCGYNFLKNKLYNSGYASTETHTNKNLYIDDYKKLKDILIKKYGKPKSDLGTFWKNDLYKDDKSQWGFAVSLGHLVYGARWETPTTKITLALKGDNYKIMLILGYNSKELEEWADEVKEESTESKF